MKKQVNIIGGGLAGAEAAAYLARHQVYVNLYEMRPYVTSEAHSSDLFGELVCSNSLKSNDLDNAAGLLKAEMRVLDSLMMEAAEASKISGGRALIVDRHKFAAYISKQLENNKYINIIREEVKEIPEGITIVASGPLTSDALTKTLENLLGEQMLGFFDASSPIVTKDSLDLSKMYEKSRYENNDGGYLNVPLTKKQYETLVRELVNAKRAPLKKIDEQYFEGCLPLEVMASRGENTLRFGPLKPKGLEQEDGTLPYAVVQLRQDDVAGNLYNLVGFQTNLTYGEQRRVFGLIPGFENAEYVRYGLMHRNTFIKAPAVLNKTLQLKNYPNIFVAGQLSGVEGYIESGASGIVAGINALRLLENKQLVSPPFETMLGALLNYLENAHIKTFAPMNANFGIIYGVNKQNRLQKASEAVEKMKRWKESIHG